MDQRGASLLACIKREGSIGTAAASGAGAFQLRLLDSPGLMLDQNPIRSGERRRDLLDGPARLSGKGVSGTYNTEITPGSAFDLLVESSTRGRWSGASDLSGGAVSATTTTSTIHRAAGSWVADGYKAGDVITPTDAVTTANNNLRLMILSVTANDITVYGTPLTVNAVARVISVLRLKKVATPTGSAAQTLDSYTAEQYNIDIDQTELFLGNRLITAAFNLRPRAMSTVAWGFEGLDRQFVDVASAPYFTSPDLSTVQPLVADDAYLFYKGSSVIPITALNFSMQFASGRQPLIGSRTDSDIYLDKLTLPATVEVVRRDLAILNDWDNETEFEVGGILRGPLADGNPRTAFGFYLARVKIGKLTAPAVGNDPAMVETRELLTTPHAGDTDNDATLVNFFSSAA